MVLLLGIIFSLSYSVITFADGYNTTEINVSIESVARITITPNYVNWSGVHPGTTGGTQTIEVLNTGSLNVTNLYAYIDTLTVEASRPYGSDEASSYAAGGVLLLRNQSDSSMGWVGRIEWNWTNTLSNLVTTGVEDPVAWGFFRNASKEYVWLIGNGTDGLCNDSGVQFALEDDEDDGTTDTRTPETTDFTTPDYTGPDWAIFSINRTTAPLYDQCVAVWVNCTKIYIYNYDKRTDPAFYRCGIADFIRNVLVPSGDSEILTLDVYVPEGIPEGNMSSSTLTVYGSS
jgi:hypothetical protein